MSWSHAVTSVTDGMSEIKKAVGILASVLAIGVLVGGFGVDYFTDTPEIARRAMEVADSSYALGAENRIRIIDLEAVDVARDRQMDRVESTLKDIQLNQCLTLAQLRGDVNADSCRPDA